MELQLLAPGVQDQTQAQIPAQAVAPQLQETLRGAIEEQREELRRIEPQQRVEFGGHREHAMIVSHGQQTALLLVEPLSALGR